MLNATRTPPGRNCRVFSTRRDAESRVESRWFLPLRHELGRGLDELDQHAFSPLWVLLASLRMDEADVVPCGTLANATGREAHAGLAKPLHGRREVVDPEAEMVRPG